MGGGRLWTKEEEDYLTEHWGTTPIGGLCKRLNRSEAAIKVRVCRLGLPPFLESGEYVTFNQLLIAVCGTNAGSGYKMKSWVKDRGFPMRHKRRGKAVIKVVYIDEFWKWAEKNRSFLDFSKMEPLALGMEPDWVAEQRHKDYTAYALQRKDVWTPEEDSRLEMLLSLHRYTWAEMQQQLRRSCGAIQRRIQDLGLTDRPIRIAGGSRAGTWNADTLQILADGIRAGDSYQAIANVLGISEKAVRGKVYTVYLTEQADRVRRMLGDGPWGAGAPEPTVKQGLHLSRTRTEIRDNLARLDAALRCRLKELRADDYYWQRLICMRWNEVDGCTAGCANCDDCTEFQRIPPQYCARCGGTFYERRQARFCQACRIARKKQAQRRWCRANAKL